MSYSTHEPLAEVITTLRYKLPDLTRMLHNGVEVPVLHGTVESIAILIARYDRGEIVERVEVDRRENGEGGKA